MLSIKLILTILTVHWLADFALQSNWQATNKWNTMGALLGHALAYTLALALAFGHSWLWLAWAVFNGAAHFGIDWLTSKQTHKCFERQDYHNGFVIVGADQLVHTTCLLWTALLCNL